LGCTSLYDRKIHKLHPQKKKNKNEKKNKTLTKLGIYVKNSKKMDNIDNPFFLEEYILIKKKIIKKKK
jgi:hypothetical protein